MELFPGVLTYLLLFGINTQPPEFIKELTVLSYPDKSEYWNGVESEGYLFLAFPKSLNLIVELFVAAIQRKCGFLH